jgi:hypothetical protein
LKFFCWIWVKFYVYVIWVVLAVSGYGVGLNENCVHLCHWVCAKSDDNMIVDLIAGHL